MTSLIERLRARHEVQRIGGGDYMTYGEGDPLALEAADALEQARQLLIAADRKGTSTGWIYKRNAWINRLDGQQKKETL